MTSPIICYVYHTYVDFNACIISDIKYMYMLTSLQALYSRQSCSKGGRSFSKQKKNACTGIN